MHQWQFFSAGGFDQVSLARGEDFTNLAELDQKLWAALACPVSGLEFDSATLRLIDTDGDGRVRASELLAALSWTLDRLASPEDLLAGSGELPLAAVVADEGGEAILAAAREVLLDAGLEGATTLDLAAAEAAAARLAARPLNGDGIVGVESTADPALQATLGFLIDAGHAETGRDGEPGVSAASFESALAEAAAALAWHEEAARAAATLMPAGAGTASAWSAVEAARAKVEDYFARCRLAAFDARAEAALNREESAWLALAAQDLGVSNEEIRGFPLARVAACARLPLAGAVNPAWADVLASLREDAVRPLLGDFTELSQERWSALLALLQPYAEWQSRKPAGRLADADPARLRELGAAGVRAAVEALIAADKALEPAFDSLADLVKLIRLRRDLAALARNFVNFADFYEQEQPAIFQCGTLYLDQRSCALCLPVTDAGKHATLAGMAGAYLAYCDCTRKASGETMQIVAAFTDGDSDNLMVGRNGIFYDRQGRDWDATITRIVDNPISVRQAFWSPYKKLVRFVEEQVVKRAAAADAAAGTRMQTAVTDGAAAAAAPAAAAPAKKIDVGTVAALGVALGSLGTAFGFFMKTVSDVKGWQVPLLVLGLMLLISGPSMVMAFLKLRRRNIAPLLDANGWAVNARALISVPFGARLTGVAALPPGSGTIGSDRFAAKGNGLLRVAMLLFVLWWLYAFLSDTGLLERLLAG